MRLLTRSDFDGSVCTAILEELGLIDDILYVHPKDMQDNKIAVSENDILANVPYVSGCGLWFDHHSSEHERLQLDGRLPVPPRSFMTTTKRIKPTPPN